jgi:amino acid transporter
MKKVTAKMFFALAAVALAAPFFAFSVFVGARAVELATDTRQNFILLALALVAAFISAVNSLGAGTRSRASSVKESSTTTTQKRSLLHHGL